MGISKIRSHIQIKIKFQIPSKEPPGSSKAPNKDSKDMNVLCNIKINIESQNSEYGCTKDQWLYPNPYRDAKSQSGTSSVLQSPKWGLKGHECPLHLQNQGREPKFGSWLYENQWPYPNQDQDAKPQAGTSSILQCSKTGLRGHECPLHLQNQNRILKFGTRVYQRPVPMSKWRSRCLTPFRILQHPAKPHIRTRRTWMFFAPSKL